MAGQDVSMTLNVLPGTFAGLTAAMSGMNNIVGLSNTLANRVGRTTSAVDSMLVVLGANLAIIGASAAKAAGEFERSMKMVRAVSGQTNAEIDVLSRTANQFTSRFKMDITDITDGLQTLGRAGLGSLDAQISVLETGLTAAKLSGLALKDVLQDLIQTTSLLGGDLTSVGFGAQVDELSNKLIGTSMTAPININDIVATLEYSGGTAAAAGIDIYNEDALYDYLGTISAFARKGVTGSMAGTALRAFFTKPASQDESVKNAFAELGISAGDLWKDNGNEMRKVSEQIQIIHDAMTRKHMSTLDQIETWGKIVGNKMGQQMMKLDANSIREVTEEIEESENASKLNSEAMQNLASETEELSQKGQTAFRNYGNAWAGIFEPIISGLNKVTDAASKNDVLSGLMDFGLKAGTIVIVTQVIGRLGNIVNLLRNIGREILDQTRNISRSKAEIQAEEAAEMKMYQTMGLTEKQAKRFVEDTRGITNGFWGANKAIVELIAQLNKVIELMGKINLQTEVLARMPVANMTANQFNRVFRNEDIPKSAYIDRPNNWTANFENGVYAKHGIWLQGLPLKEEMTKMANYGFSADFLTQLYTGTVSSKNMKKYGISSPDAFHKWLGKNPSMMYDANLEGESGKIIPLTSLETFLKQNKIGPMYQGSEADKVTSNADKNAEKVVNAIKSSSKSTKKGSQELSDSERRRRDFYNSDRLKSQYGTYTNYQKALEMEQKRHEQAAEAQNNLLKVAQAHQKEGEEQQKKIDARKQRKENAKAMPASITGGTMSSILKVYQAERDKLNSAERDKLKSDIKSIENAQITPVNFTAMKEEFDQAEKMKEDFYKKYGKSFGSVNAYDTTMQSIIDSYQKQQNKLEKKLSEQRKTAKESLKPLQSQKDLIDKKISSFNIQDETFRRMGLGSMSQIQKDMYESTIKKSRRTMNRAELYLQRSDITPEQRQKAEAVYKVNKDFIAPYDRALQGATTHLNNLKSASDKYAKDIQLIQNEVKTTEKELVKVIYELTRFRKTLSNSIGDNQRKDLEKIRATEKTEQSIKSEQQRLAGLQNFAKTEEQKRNELAKLDNEYRKRNSTVQHGYDDYYKEKNPEYAKQLEDDKKKESERIKKLSNKALGSPGGNYRYTPGQLQQESKTEPTTQRQPSEIITDGQKQSRDRLRESKKDWDAEQKRRQGIRLQNENQYRNAYRNTLLEQRKTTHDMFFQNISDTQKYAERQRNMVGWLDPTKYTKPGTTNQFDRYSINPHQYLGYQPSKEVEWQGSLRKATVNELEKATKSIGFGSRFKNTLDKYVIDPLKRTQLGQGYMDAKARKQDPDYQKNKQLARDQAIWDAKLSKYAKEISSFTNKRGETSNYGIPNYLMNRYRPSVPGTDTGKPAMDTRGWDKFKRGGMLRFVDFEGLKSTAQSSQSLWRSGFKGRAIGSAMGGAAGFFAESMFIGPIEAAMMAFSLIQQTYQYLLQKYNDKLTKLQSALSSSVDKLDKSISEYTSNYKDNADDIEANQQKIFKSWDKYTKKAKKDHFGTLTTDKNMTKSDSRFAGGSRAAENALLTIAMARESGSIANLDQSTSKIYSTALKIRADTKALADHQTNAILGQFGIINYMTDSFFQALGQGTWNDDMTVYTESSSNLKEAARLLSSTYNNQRFGGGNVYGLAENYIENRNTVASGFLPITLPGDEDTNWKGGIYKDLREVRKLGSYSQYRNLESGLGKYGTSSMNQMITTLHKNEKDFKYLGKLLIRSNANSGRLNNYVRAMQVKTGFSDIQIKQLAAIQAINDLRHVAESSVLPAMKDVAMAGYQAAQGTDLNAYINQNSAQSESAIYGAASNIAANVAVLTANSLHEQATNDTEENRAWGVSYGKALEWASGKGDFVTRALMAIGGRGQQDREAIIQSAKNILSGEVQTGNQSWTSAQVKKWVEDNWNKVQEKYPGMGANDIFKALENTALKGISGRAYDQLLKEYLSEGESDDSGSGSGSGDGNKDKSSRKNWVNLAICNKKEIPKLNVNLFKKPPNFTILNRNLKLRDFNINTADDAKSIQNAVKNTLIEVQNRSSPKIIQDEEAEYDPIGATDGKNIPTGEVKTK